METSPSLPTHPAILSDLHSFCEMQLRDAKERESTWKKFRASIEKQNLELKATIAQKDEELKAANKKIEELVS